MREPPPSPLRPLEEPGLFFREVNPSQPHRAKSPAPAVHMALASRQGFTAVCAFCGDTVSSVRERWAMRVQRGRACLRHIPFSEHADKIGRPPFAHELLLQYTRGELCPPNVMVRPWNRLSLAFQVGGGNNCTQQVNYHESTIYCTTM